jgi:hypothetical protein
MNASTYPRRLLISLAVVCGACSLIFFRGTFSDAATSTWFWLAVVSDMFKLRLDFHPAVFTIFTAAVLAVAALRRGLSVGVTVWFVLNVLGGLWFLSAYDGRS